MAMILTIVVVLVVAIPSSTEWQHRKAMTYVLEEASGTVSFDSPTRKSLIGKILGMRASAIVTGIDLGVGQAAGHSAKPATREQARKTIELLFAFDKLESLSVAGLPVHDSDLVPLLSVQNPKLRVLDISGTNVTDAFMDQLREERPLLSIRTDPLSDGGSPLEPPGGEGMP
jgi:hypothetical protein